MSALYIYKFPIRRKLKMLITQEKEDDKIQFRIRMHASVLKEVEDYCQWAGIQYKDYFIQRACEYIFKHDEEWINYKIKQGENSGFK